MGGGPLECRRSAENGVKGGRFTGEGLVSPSPARRHLSDLTHISNVVSPAGFGRLWILDCANLFLPPRLQDRPQTTETPTRRCHRTGARNGPSRRLRSWLPWSAVRTVLQSCATQAPRGGLPRGLNSVCRNQAGTGPTAPRTFVTPGVRIRFAFMRPRCVYDSAEQVSRHWRGRRNAGTGMMARGRYSGPNEASVLATVGTDPWDAGLVFTQFAQHRVDSVVRQHRDAGQA